MGINVHFMKMHAGKKAACVTSRPGHNSMRLDA